jgi:hypothetical protein
MSLKVAQANAWSLAKTLMVCVVLFQTTDGYGVMPTPDFDGDPGAVVREYDPFS